MLFGPMLAESPSNKMADCDDPYREVELYLEKAQEEIGRAVKELEEHEESILYEQSDENFSNDTSLLPPQPYECKDWNTKPSNNNSKISNSSHCSVNRVCYDGSVQVFSGSSGKVDIPSNIPTSRASFVSTFNNGIAGRSGRVTYSPNTRRRLWRMHPSISFPETSKDLLSLGKEVHDSDSSSNGWANNAFKSDEDNQLPNRRESRYRQRSNSDTLAPFLCHDIPDHSYGFPRPPSGDVNLLSIWADNLVLELDKSLSGELMNSLESFSPSSDYSLSPNKQEDTLEGANRGLGIENNGQSRLLESNFLSLSGKSLKTVSKSPDSGIEHPYCDTPEMTEDCVDSSIAPKLKLKTLNINLLITHEEAEHITPPPAQFKDEAQKVFSKPDRSQYTQTCRKRSGSLKSAELVLEPQETTENLKTLNQMPGAQVIPSETIQEFEDYPLVQTVCAVNDVPTVNTDVRAYQGEPCNTSISKNIASHPVRSILPSYNGLTNFNSLPKTPKILPINTDKWSTLPRDNNKGSDSALPQRSASQSAMNYVSIDELADFMRKVKNGCYHPPSCADVSTDVKDDNENRDAVTQTTPVPLSRSSSFTCVTECDCSDLELHDGHNGSNDSLGLSGCSDCKVENGDFPSSSSSVGESSEDSESPRPISGSSSLYLSACSGSSDSFEEPGLLNDAANSESVTLVDDVFLPSTQRSYRGSESTLRGSVLGDITEEQITSETISVRSNLSNPSLLDTNSGDPVEQSASFPSTLRASKKNRSTGSPAQPIEPTVLVINDSISVSAPVLLRQKRYVTKPNIESSSSDSSPPTEARSKDALSGTNQVPATAHSAKELNELQALEACGWLRAAGFPQYAQMYEDDQFPIDISIVQKDHTFLHPDSIQSLFRRLNALNRCVKMKFVDPGHCKSVHVEESDEEEQYALSENWEFQRSSRRWSRIPSPSDDATELPPNNPTVNPNFPDHTLASAAAAAGRKYLSPEQVYCSSHDSVFIDDQHSSPDSIRRASMNKSERMLSPSGHIGDCSPGSSSGSGTLSLASEDTKERRSLRRSGSDRVKEGAKALLRRMESLKGKRKKKGTETNKVEKAAAAHNGTDGSSSGSLTSSPQFRRSRRTEVIRPDLQPETLLTTSDNTLHRNFEDIGAHSDSEFLFCPPSNAENQVIPFASGTSVTITGPQEEFPINQNEESKKDKSKSNSIQKNLLHPNSGSSQTQESNNRGSYYDNVSAPIVVFNDVFTDCLDENTCRGASQGEGSGANQNAHQNQEDGDIIIINKERRDSGVGSSLTRGVTYQQTPWHCFPLHCSTDIRFLSMPMHISQLTVPQMLFLRKLSLLKLTAVMEKFSPSNRSGWSWGVSKLITRIRNPDYKDKVAFGVPLSLILQRTGQPLPVSIQAAMHHLRKTSFDSVGLFRKSGVRSRIQKLRTLVESNPEKISYEDQQAYDVADMIKQYFRELPEVLFTNKLSETFVTIFQFVPEQSRLESIQAALMLMPEENREVLQALLEFLHEVCQHADINQMNATNLAVCIAPSLFHRIIPRSASSSPRRRKTVGVPDIRELNENRAASECLACMVENYRTLFTVPTEVIAQSRLSSAMHLQPARLDDLSSYVFNGLSGWKGYVDICTQIFLKDAKEKYKGWKNVSQSDHVELSYKKVSDEHPLKLWKVSTEVEAPPVELLNKILRERHLWDTSFVTWKVVSRLNKHSEVFQYLTTNLSPRPPSDFVLLRSWKTDLIKGACTLIETSIDHSEAEVMPGSVRALALASRYLIEPCGSGKSRITYISRIDLRGRSPDWYSRAYGQMCTLFMVKLRNSFSRTRADGPETKV